jgi:putative colanic acid biosynthesis acetyltransferase WcaF
LNPKKQNHPYQNPWPLWVHLILVLWKFSWFFFCSWTPKFLNAWRLMILKFFGATISGCPFVHSKAWIQVPWHLTMHHRACLGERSVAYSIGRIEIMEAATVAQEVYLCTGTHDFERTDMQLLTQSITIEKNAFIGVRAMILPGVKIGENAIVGAQAVVCKNVPKNEIFAGNPARKISIRKKI